MAAQDVAHQTVEGNGRSLCDQRSGALDHLEVETCRVRPRRNHDNRPPREALFPPPESETHLARVGRAEHQSDAILAGVRTRAA